MTDPNGETRHLDSSIQGSHSGPPEPYYEDDFATIYHGDCLEVLRSLPSSSVDVVLTDPPYCSGGYMEAQKNTKAQGLRGATVAAEGFEWFADNMGTAGLTWLLREVMVQVRRLLAPNRGAFVFTDWRMVTTLAPAIESVGLRFRNQLMWDKGNAGLGVGFKPAYEVVMEFSKGSTTYAAKNGQNVLRFPRVPSGEKEHGAAKPLALLSEVLRMVDVGQSVVLDPFLGSGSTLVAAKARGLPCVGIEVEERYCEIAAKRLAQEVLDFGGVA